MFTFFRVSPLPAKNIIKKYFSDGALACAQCMSQCNWHAEIKSKQAENSMPFPYPISSPTNTNVQCVESIEDIYKSNSKCPANNFPSLQSIKYLPQNIMQSIQFKQIYKCKYIYFFCNEKEEKLKGSKRLGFQNYLKNLPPRQY